MLSLNKNLSNIIKKSENNYSMTPANIDRLFYIVGYSEALLKLIAQNPNGPAVQLYEEWLHYQDPEFNYNVTSMTRMLPSLLGLGTVLRRVVNWFAPKAIPTMTGSTSNYEVSFSSYYMNHRWDLSKIDSQQIFKHNVIYDPKIQAHRWSYRNLNIMGNHDRDSKYDVRYCVRMSLDDDADSVDEIKIPNNFIDTWFILTTVENTQVVLSVGAAVFKDSTVVASNKLYPGSCGSPVFYADPKGTLQFKGIISKVWETDGITCAYAQMPPVSRPPLDVPTLEAATEVSKIISAEDGLTQTVTVKAPTGTGKTTAFVVAMCISTKMRVLVSEPRVINTNIADYMSTNTKSLTFAKYNGTLKLDENQKAEVRKAHVVYATDFFATVPILAQMKAFTDRLIIQDEAHVRTDFSGAIAPNVRISATIENPDVEINQRFKYQPIVPDYCYKANQTQVASLCKILLHLYNQRAHLLNIGKVMIKVHTLDLVTDMMNHIKASSPNLKVSEVSSRIKDVTGDVIVGTEAAITGVTIDGLVLMIDCGLVIRRLWEVNPDNKLCLSYTEYGTYKSSPYDIEQSKGRVRRTQDGSFAYIEWNGVPDQPEHITPMSLLLTSGHPWLGYYDFIKTDPESMTELGRLVSKGWDAQFFLNNYNPDDASLPSKVVEKLLPEDRIGYMPASRDIIWPGQVQKNGSIKALKPSRLKQMCVEDFIPRKFSGRLPIQFEILLMTLAASTGVSVYEVVSRYVDKKPTTEYGTTHYNDLLLESPNDIDLFNNLIKKVTENTPNRTYIQESTGKLNKKLDELQIRLIQTKEKSYEWFEWLKEKTVIIYSAVKPKVITAFEYILGYFNLELSGQYQDLRRLLSDLSTQEGFIEFSATLFARMITTTFSNWVRRYIYSEMVKNLATKNKYSLADKSFVLMTMIFYGLSKIPELFVRIVFMNDITKFFDLSIWSLGNVADYSKVWWLATNTKELKYHDYKDDVVDSFVSRINNYSKYSLIFANVLGATPVQKLIWSGMFPRGISYPAHLTNYLLTFREQTQPKPVVPVANIVSPATPHPTQQPGMRPMNSSIPKFYSGSKVNPLELSVEEAVEFYRRNRVVDTLPLVRVPNPLPKEVMSDIRAIPTKLMVPAKIAAKVGLEVIGYTKKYSKEDKGSVAKVRNPLLVALNGVAENKKIPYERNWETLGYPDQSEIGLAAGIAKRKLVIPSKKNRFDIPEVTEYINFMVEKLYKASEGREMNYSMADCVSRMKNSAKVHKWNHFGEMDSKMRRNYEFYNKYLEDCEKLLDDVIDGKPIENTYYSFLKIEKLPKKDYSISLSLNDSEIEELLKFTNELPPAMKERWRPLLSVIKHMREGEADVRVRHAPPRLITTSSGPLKACDSWCLTALHDLIKEVIPELFYGRTVGEYAKEISEMYDTTKLLVGMDMSNFDSTVTCEDIAIEMLIYKKFFEKKGDKRRSKYVDFMLVDLCRRYEIYEQGLVLQSAPGTRPSGHQTTSVGNSIKSHFYVWLLFKRYPQNFKSAKLQSDDILMAVDRNSDYTDIETIIQDVGMEFDFQTKFVEFYSEPQEVSFLSSGYTKIRISSEEYTFQTRPLEECLDKIICTPSKVLTDHGKHVYKKLDSSSDVQLILNEIKPQNFSLLYSTIVSYLILYCSHPEIVHLCRLLLSIIPTSCMIFNPELDHDMWWKMSNVNIEHIPNVHEIYKYHLGYDVVGKTINFPILNVSTRFKPLVQSIDKCRSTIRKKYGDTVEFVDYYKNNTFINPPKTSSQLPYPYI